MEIDRAKFEWVPKLRVKLVAPDGQEFEFPMAGTWLSQHHDIGSNTLTRNECKALWRWLGRTDKAPARLTIFINSEDLMQSFPPEPLPPDWQRRRRAGGAT